MRFKTIEEARELAKNVTLHEIGGNPTDRERHAYMLGFHDATRVYAQQYITLRFNAVIAKEPLRSSAETSTGQAAEAFADPSPSSEKPSPLP